MRRTRESLGSGEVTLRKKQQREEAGGQGATRVRPRGPPGTIREWVDSREGQAGRDGPMRRGHRLYSLTEQEFGELHVVGAGHWGESFLLPFTIPHLLQLF